MDGWRRRDTAGEATVGVVLVIALVIAGSTLVVALGNQALTDTERQSDLKRAEQAMTLFDSQTAQVALSDSDVQTIRFGRTGGSYNVDPDAGEISIINVDRDDDGADDDGNIDPDEPGPSDPSEDDEYILSPTSLGAVVYDNGDRRIAYQGGGVWEKGPGDGVRMISPPEFHYRAQTLTLPVIQVAGSGGAGGSARAAVSKGAFSAKQIYPNSGSRFDIPVADGEQFVNPVSNGSVIVRVESEYARAWGRYFDERTDGVVSYPSPGVVTVELVSLAQIGEFDMPLDGGSVPVTGASGGHGIDRPDAGETAFSIRIRPDDADSAKFSNLQWSLYADDGPHEFELHLKKAGSGDDCSDGSTSLGADVTIYYSWNNGADYHGWKSTTPVQASCANLDTSDPEDEIYFDITFVDDDDSDGEYDDYEGSDIEFDFVALSDSDLEHFSPTGSLDSSRDLDGHSPAWEPSSPTAITFTSDMLINHYFAELPPEFELTVDDKNSDTLNEDASGGTFYTSGNAKYVTYLHVTTNQVEVEVGS